MVGAGRAGERERAAQADERAGGQNRGAAQGGLQIHAYSCTEIEGYGAGKQGGNRQAMGAARASDDASPHRRADSVSSAADRP
ncbi:hypothetical protein Aau02nite_62140 [Amorphoplanes auranticolor]|uniref:Uncharacterized protein n=1 Tax=Actinoplanes auranticolor TaxID=47988 RepID=A0A919SN86_9ACTN|nr:hypothetical protein Aau02nite_62140 [Actinoplanes auranticolor]